MIRYAQALACLEELAAARRSSLNHEGLPVTEALGRVCARDHLGQEDLPAFDNSAMDGYAVRSADTWSASPSSPLSLPLRGESAAGHTAEFDAGLNLEPGRATAYRIMTGAPVPPGYDAVVKREDTLEGEHTVCLQGACSPGLNVRYRGEDFAAGDLAIPRRQLLTPEDLMLAAALGISHLELLRKPRVIVIATGEELSDWRSPHLAAGSIRNATTPYLMARLEQTACQLLYHRCVGDKPEAIAAALEEALSHKPDVILTTGGVSAGRYDYIPEVVAKLGGHSPFHKVAIRPGKPLLCAAWQQPTPGPVLFGLPGNPVSSSVGFSFFVLPYLRHLLGLAPLQFWSASLAAPVRTEKSLHTFLKAQLFADADGHGLKVKPLGRQGSHRMAALRTANAWCVVDDETDGLEAGAVLPVILNSQLCLS